MDEENGEEKVAEPEPSVVDRGVATQRKANEADAEAHAQRVRSYEAPGEREDWEDPRVQKAVARMNWRRPKLRALIAQVNRKIDVRVVGTTGAEAKTGNYLPDDDGIFRLDRWLPPGLYQFHTQGDPEPKKIRPPSGLTAWDAMIMYGRWTLRAAGAGLGERQGTLPGRIIAVAVAAAALVVGGVIYYGWRFGGWFA